MKFTKNYFILNSILFVLLVFSACKNSASSDDNSEIIYDNNTQATTTSTSTATTPTESTLPPPTLIPNEETAEIIVKSTVPYPIRIFSNLGRTQLVEEIPAYGITTIKTSQIPTAVFYYTFLIEFDSEQKLWYPYYGDDCAFAVATSISKPAVQQISFPKKNKFPSCCIMLKNETFSAIKLMKGENPVSNTNLDGFVNPGETEVYEIRNIDFPNLNSYTIRDVFGKNAIALNSFIKYFEAGKVYKISYKEDSAELYDEIKLGILSYIVEHKKEMLSGEYELVKTEILYGIANTMTGAAPEKYENFIPQEFSQQELKTDSTVITIYYKLKSSTFTFNANGGIFNDGSTEKILTGKIGTIVEPPELPQKENAIFIGWDATIPENFGTEDIVFSAIWKTITFSITYKLNGGTNSPKNPSSYIRNTGKIILSAPTKEGFEFIGWYTDESFNNGIFQIDTTQGIDITVYARWIDTTFEVTDSNISSVISECKISSYTYTLKLTGEITANTIKKLTNAIKSKPSSKFRIEILNCTGLTGLGDDGWSSNPPIFSDMNNLVSVKLGGSINTLDNNAFSNCPKLEKIELLGNFVNIGIESFGKANGNIINNCPCLTSIKIPATVEKIAPYTFGSSDSIQTFEIDLNNKNYSLSNDKKFILSKDKTILVCTGGDNTDIVIPQEVKEIANYAFYNSKIKSVLFNSKVETIGEYAFAYTINLPNVFIPDNVKRIGKSAFYGSGITEATIGKGIEFIDSCAFYYFKNRTDLSDDLSNHPYEFLEKVTIKATVPPKSSYNTAICGENYISGSFSYPYVYVPKESVELYRNASAFENRKKYIREITN